MFEELARVSRLGRIGPQENAGIGAWFYLG